MTPDALLADFRARIRLAHREDEPAPGIVLDAAGPVLRRYPVEPGTSWCMVQSPAGLLEDPDRHIEDACAFFGARGEAFEWKTCDDDLPPDLLDRLVRRGFEPDPPEALMLGELASLVADVRTDATVARLRPGESCDGIGRLMVEVWRGTTERAGWLADEMADNPDLIDVFVATDPDDGRVVSAAWVRYTPGTGWASFWGGMTAPGWRGRGAYRALVSARAKVAIDKGYRFVRVDCTPDSEPILTRLGLVRAATTTPARWAPGS